MQSRPAEPQTASQAKNWFACASVSVRHPSSPAFSPPAPAQHESSQAIMFSMQASGDAANEKSGRTSAANINAGSTRKGITCK
ncbi:Uncharacterised protein [uncultured archaeon]|nr:Uncharacterised protein [uncultured archaeon]